MWGNLLESVAGKTETGAVASDQTKLSFSAILNVSMSVERRLLTGY